MTETSRTVALDAHIRRLAKQLVDSVDLDNNGMMIGQHYVGGNGGLHSHATIAAADALRLALNTYEQIANEPSPTDPEAADALRQRARENHL